MIIKAKMVVVESILMFLLVPARISLQCVEDILAGR